MKSAEETVKAAREAIRNGKAIHAAELLEKAANQLVSSMKPQWAKNLYIEASNLYSEEGEKQACFNLLEKATLAFIRQDSDPEIHEAIVALNENGGMIAEKLEEYQKAADFYFRSKDFAADAKVKDRLTIRAADALENLADIHEDKNEFDEAVELLKKVGRLYYTVDDEELGHRIHERAIRLASRWADISKDKGDYLAAGNALAEAAQIMQSEDEAAEAIPLMMKAGRKYEKAELFEKAGNIYDAAQEAYGFERLSSGQKKAATKAAEAYTKMSGAPNVVAPLLVRAGELFRKAGRIMKARWAYKRAGNLFGELADAAALEEDDETENKYRRYRAMCLREWGQEEKANEIYAEVIDFYLKRAQIEKERGRKERQATSFEEAAKVMREASQEEKAKETLAQALGIYVELAETASEAGQPGEASEYFSKAAECSNRLESEKDASSFHVKASQKAKEAANMYEELDVSELSAIWNRTAGREALRSGNSETIEQGIQLLQESSSTFNRIGEKADAFEDLFSVFEGLFLHFPEREEDIENTVQALEEIARAENKDEITALIPVLKALKEKNFTTALMAFQENEDDLMDKSERIRRLLDSLPGDKMGRRTPVKKYGRIA
jgi:tetratricopeptide (TPR) repeat protein